MALLDYLYHLLSDLTVSVKSKQGLELFRIAAAVTLGTYAARKIIWIPFKLYVLAQYLPGVRLEKLGRWAVVTGATDGIGEGYARELASRGLDIVLISRSADRLNTVKDEIVRDFQREVKVIQADFKTTVIYERIGKELEGLEIAVLVNNVGMALSFSPFLETPNILDSSRDILSVNCLSMTAMCGLVLPAMIERQRGVVINVSSILGQFGSVNSSNYAATKSYVELMSRSLQRTYAPTGVIIQTLTPGLIQTKLLTKLLYERDSILKSVFVKLLSTTVSKFVRSAVNTIGWSDYCHGHLVHYPQSFLFTVIPESIGDWLMSV